MESFVGVLDAAVRGLSGITAGLGLFTVAFFDSSLLSLPEVNDILLVYFGARFPDNAYYYALMMVLGSASGGSLLYALARWRGYSLLEKKFPSGRVRSVVSLVSRFGVLAVLVPALLPPPFPFKIFVLSAGVLGLHPSRFLLAILAGRSIRYFGEAWLALRYGEHALGYLQAHSKHAFAAAVIVVVVVVAVELVLLWRRRRAASSEDGESFARPRPLEGE
jgi:membrane protein YqaA with SNARE-associated domain